MNAPMVLYSRIIYEITRKVNIKRCGEIVAYAGKEPWLFGGTRGDITDLPVNTKEICPFFR
jgi:hypothetical protein